MEKLGQLQRDAREAGTYDLIVVDTPPSRSALDFLDAPERLSSFLDGRFVRMLLAPARGPARIMTAGLGLVTGALSQDPRRPVHHRPADLRRRPGHGLRRLPGPRPADLRAAAGARYGVPGRGRARARRAARGGVLRRAARRGADAAGRPGGQPRQPRPDSARCRPTRRWRPRPGCAGPRPRPPAPLTAGLLRLHADRERMVEREAALRERFAAAHPAVADRGRPGAGRRRPRPRRAARGRGLLADQG